MNDARPTTCGIAFQLVEPLLSGETTGADRLLCWFGIAESLLHEFTVSASLSIFFCE